jgi:serine/threonine protein kinase
METPPELNPLQLPPGTQVGPWRVVRWSNRGIYGTVYRAVSSGQDEPVPVALKLAVHPGDPRFGREVALLSCLDHPSVPRLMDHGHWQSPSGASHPYLTMEWIEGTPLYDWAREAHASSRQVLQLLAQLARALQATHAVGGVHRDVKGNNVLVGRSDTRAVLTDFGSANYRGADRLTWQAQPPGTPAYRSPEAWRFLLRYGLASDAHYVATPADDLFALGVTAYRLVTGQYPPSTQPGREEAHAWEPEGPGPRPPQALNPRVEPRLSALILRMLSAAPEARGTAGELAEALELAVKHAGAKADQPLFESKPQQPPAPAKPQAPAALKSSNGRIAPREHALKWLPWLASAAAGLLLLLWARQAVHVRAERVFARVQAAPSANRPDAGTAAVGESSMEAPLASKESPSGQKAVAEDTPPELFPRQATPDEKGRCPSPGQVAINKGCWLEFPMEAAPCEANGYLLHQGKCYTPVFALRRRKPTSSPTDSP